MSIRGELIADALESRFKELRCRAAALAPASFGEMSTFVSQVSARLSDAPPDELETSLRTLNAPDLWMATDGDDGLTALRRLALGEPLRLRAIQPPPLAPFMRTLSSASGREPDERFRLLTERYACPLNFALPSEDEAREHILTRLMSQDRARIERGSPETIDSDDLLLRLNLIALPASLAPDLRFLDALNYYYELLPAAWQPRGEHSWLLASYFAHYARALAMWISGR